MSLRSASVKALMKSTTAMISSPDIIKLNFGELIDLSLGQTGHSKSYGAVSFGLLRELLLAIVDRMGVRNKIALSYDMEQPPEFMSAANSPVQSFARVDRKQTDMVEQEVVRATRVEGGIPVSPEIAQTRPVVPTTIRSESSAQMMKPDERVKALHIDQPEDAEEKTTREQLLNDRLLKLEEVVAGLSSQALSDLDKEDVDMTRKTNPEEFVSFEGRLAAMEVKFDSLSVITNNMKERLEQIGNRMEELRVSSIRLPHDDIYAQTSDVEAREMNNASDQKIEGPSLRQLGEQGSDQTMSFLMEHPLSSSIDSTHTSPDRPTSKLQTSQPDRLSDSAATIKEVVSPTCHVESAISPVVISPQLSESPVESQMSYKQMKKLNAEHAQAVSNLLHDVDNLMQQIQELKHGLFVNDQILEKLKTLVGEKFFDIESMMSTCVTWESLEKYLSSAELESSASARGQQQPQSTTIQFSSELPTRFPRHGHGQMKQESATATTSSMEAASMEKSNTQFYMMPHRPPSPPRPTSTGSKQQNEDIHQSLLDGVIGTAIGKPSGSALQVKGSGRVDEQRSGYEPHSLVKTATPPEMSSPRQEDRRHEDSHTPTGEVSGQKAMQLESVAEPTDWQEMFGILETEREIDSARQLTKLKGPSEVLKRTLGSIGKMVAQAVANATELQKSICGELERVNEIKADKSDVEERHEAMSEKLRELEELAARQTKEITIFRELVQHVTAQKVDKDYVNAALAMKSDKKDVSNLVSFQFFNKHVHTTEIALDDLRNKLRTVERESNFKNTAEKLLMKINSKADKEELSTLKQILGSFESKLSSISANAATVKVDDAAVVKKKLLPLNCLVCDKHTNIDPSKSPMLIPAEPNFMTSKSNKPYTTFEMRSIRDQLLDREDRADIYSAPRPVGGAYTMVDPLKHIRQIKASVLAEEGGLQSHPGISPSAATAFAYPTINVYNQVVVGQDGKIYKAGSRQDRLPDIPTTAPNADETLISSDIAKTDATNGYPQFV